MRYSNANTRRYYERDLTALFGFAVVDLPAVLTESMVLAWCGPARANNTVLNTLSRACTFLRWCVRQGEADAALVEALMGRDDDPSAQIARLYREGAGCGAGSVAQPLGRLRTSDRIGPGAALIRCLDRLAVRQEQLLGRPLGVDEPVICGGKSGAGTGQPVADRRIAQTVSAQQIVARRAQLAGLGHAAPHDLRRTAAGLLHRSVGPDGSHHAVDDQYRQWSGRPRPPAPAGGPCQPVRTVVGSRRLLLPWLYSPEAASRRAGRFGMAAACEWA